MKLKKIASLALAGIMAVSMLAGCSGKTENNENGSVVVTPGSSSIATAFNNGQDADNKVKVTFTADSKLESQLNQVVKLVGVLTTGDGIENAIETLTGKTNGILYTSAANAKKGEVVTEWFGLAADSNTYWSETDAINAAARAVNKQIASLPLNNKDGKTEGQKYIEFSYTGSVAVLTVENVDGTTSYYGVYSITQTAAEKTVERAA